MNITYPVVFGIVQEEKSPLHRLT